jgi:hypothetical protein
MSAKPINMAPNTRPIGSSITAMRWVPMRSMSSQVSHTA